MSPLIMISTCLAGMLITLIGGTHHSLIIAAWGETLIIAVMLVNEIVTAIKGRR